MSRFTNLKLEGAGYTIELTEMEEHDELALTEGHETQTLRLASKNHLNDLRRILSEWCSIKEDDESEPDENDDEDY